MIYLLAQTTNESPLWQGGWEAVVAWCILGVIGFIYLCGFCYFKYLDCERHGNYNDYHRIRGWKYHRKPPEKQKDFWREK